jgi:hypothetical protein
MERKAVGLVLAIVIALSSTGRGQGPRLDPAGKTASCDHSQGDWLRLQGSLRPLRDRQSARQTWEFSKSQSLYAIATSPDVHSASAASLLMRPAATSSPTPSLQLLQIRLQV